MPAVVLYSARSAWRSLYAGLRGGEVVQGLLVLGGLLGAVGAEVAHLLFERGDAGLVFLHLGDERGLAGLGLRTELLGGGFHAGGDGGFDAGGFGVDLGALFVEALGLLGDVFEFVGDGALALVEIALADGARGVELRLLLAQRGLGGVDGGLPRRELGLDPRAVTGERIFGGGEALLMGE